MKVYLPNSQRTHRMFVQPGNEFPTSEFLEKDGKAKLFTVEFTGGQAKVFDQLGQYMIDKGMAQRSPIILPPNV